jgi:dolichyl-phosphate-mannose-protein mannosyltransferase
MSETTAAPRQFGKRLDTRGGLLCLFALGLAIRLLLAWRSNGLEFDISLFRAWSDRLVADGPSRMYAGDHFDPISPNFVDYAPGYLYVLYGLGKLSQVLTGDAPSVFLLKLPAIVADLGLAVVVMAIAQRLRPLSTEGRVPVRVAAAAAILFNPAIILVSAVWGQVDSVLALLVLGALYLLTANPDRTWWTIGGVSLLALAIATKPQAVLAVPIVVLVLVGQMLRARPRPTAGQALGRIALAAGCGFLVLVVLFLPFGVGPFEIPEFYRSAGAVYPFTSLWAFNVWGATAFYRLDSGTDAFAIFGIEAFALGLIAFAVGLAWLLWRAWRSRARDVSDLGIAVFGVVATTCLAFALLTRSHERYLYLAVAGLAPLIGRRAFAWSLAVLSLLFFLDVHFAYVLFSDHQAATISALFDAAFGTVTNAWQRKVLSAATAVTCVIVAARGWKWLENRPG